MAAFAAASAALECGSLLPLFYSVAQKRQFTAASSFCGSAVTLPKSGMQAAALQSALRAQKRA